MDTSGEMLEQMWYNEGNLSETAGVLLARAAASNHHSRERTAMATSDHTSTTLEIQLTKGCTALIDAVDSDLAALKWCANPYRNRTYAVRGASTRGGGKGRHIRLHRVILSRMLGRELASSEIVDHINGNALDNRRCNLRLATVYENALNRGIQANNASGFKGVTWHKGNNRWRATIVVRVRQVHLGGFDTAEEASIAYQKAALRLHGDWVPAHDKGAK